MSPEELPVNVIDGGVALILLGSALLAFARGFIKELLSIVGWVGAILVALYLFPYVQPLARKYIELELAADAATAVGIFVVSLFLFGLVGHVIAERVRDSDMSFLDRTLGFLFGLVRGALIVSIAFVLFARLTPRDEYPDFVQEARVLPLMMYGGGLIQELVPEQVLLSGNEAVAAAAEKASQSLTLEQAVRQFLEYSKPVAAEPKPDSTGETGYKSGDRQQLEQLIERNGKK